MALFSYLKMSLDNFFQLGTISKAYSFKGEVILYIDADNPNHYYKIKDFFIQINGRLIPYLIQKSAVHKKNQLKLKIEGIESEQDANQIIKKDVYLPLEKLPKLNDNQFYFHEIIDYEVVDTAENKEVGIIVNVIDHPGNTLIEVEQNGIEIILPINDSTFQKIDKETKQLFLDIPEGLIAIYLENE